MKKQILTVIGIFIILSGCDVVKPHSGVEPILFKIDHSPVSVAEFKYVYEKNNFNNDSIYYPKDIDNYLDLYINFKLKIQEAEAEGYDTTRAFLNEYNKYKEQLIKPYLPEEQEIEKLTKEAYERMKTEVNAAHILVRLPENPSPEDTLKAYQKILEIRQKALDGTPFDQLAKQFSEDPSARLNGGHLGYFTVFQMVYPFEQAAYTTPAGQISPIVRTQFGYHIIKIYDRRPSQGTVKVAHIMVRMKPDKSDSVATRNKIFEIYDQLASGADWNMICSQFSDDLRTKNSGGELPYFGIGQIDQEFADAAFSLDSTGQISDPFQTRYGWHIIRLIDKKPIDSFKDMKQQLESKVRRDQRSKLGQQAVLSRLKQKYNFREYPAALDSILQHADSTLLQGQWHPGELHGILQNPMIAVNGKNYTIGNFVDFVQKHQTAVQNITPQDQLKSICNQYVTDRLYAEEEQNLIAHNTEFHFLLNEYYEGILLFDIMENNVWNKASTDSAGLTQFFNDNREKYSWGPRADAVIFDASNADVLSDIKNHYLNQDPVTLDEFHLKLLTELDSNQKEKLRHMAELFTQATDARVLITVPKKIQDSLFITQIKEDLINQGISKQYLIEKYNENTSEDVDIAVISSSKKSLELLYNKESALTLQVDEEKFEREGNEILQKIPWKPGSFETNMNNRFYLVNIKKIIPPQLKALDETRGAVISDYQNYLEKQWIKELKKKFKVEINNKELDKIYREFEAKRAALGS